jgi:hypothetical protein
MSFFKHLRQYAQDLETLAEKEDQNFFEYLGGIYKAGKTFGERASSEDQQPDEESKERKS